MTAGTGGGFHAVAGGVHALVAKVEGQRGFVGLEVLALNGALHHPCVVLRADGKFADPSFRQNLPTGVRYVFGQGAVHKGLGKAAHGNFLSTVHGYPQSMRNYKVKR